MEKLKPCPFCGEKEDISLKVKRYHGGAVEVNGNKFGMLNVFHVMLEQVIVLI